MKPEERSLGAALAAVSALLLALRLVAAARVGFGDSEALYAAYALFPQPAYLDHPGLVGVIASAIGHGGTPSPYAAHVVTSVAATLFPVAMAAAARAIGAGWRASFAAGLAVAVVPEIAVGLFALTPDLPLAFAWIGGLTCAAIALAAPPNGSRAAAAFLGAGLAVGIAMSAKVSGGALLLAVAGALAAPAGRRHAKTIWPYLALALAFIIVLPIALYEARMGFPMLRHRLVATQVSAGISLRNVAAVLGGQLAYLSPLLAIAAGYVARDLLVRKRTTRDAVDVLLLAAFVFPLGLLLPLCLWSRVAEPHWLAPAFLALPLHYARRYDERAAFLSRRLARAAVATALVLVLAVHAWVLVPALVRLTPESADPRFDIANELYGWPDVLREVNEAVEQAQSPTRAPGEIVVVGPHWIVCAQLRAGLPSAIPVGCATPIQDDFDRWYSRNNWLSADTIVFVTDNRFNTDAPPLLLGFATAHKRTVTVTRGGRPARLFVIEVMVRRAAG